MDWWTWRDNHGIGTSASLTALDKVICQGLTFPESRSSYFVYPAATEGQSYALSILFQYIGSFALLDAMVWEAEVSQKWGEQVLKF